MIKLIPVFFSIFLFGFGGVFLTPKTFTGYFDTNATTNIQNGTGNWDFSTSNFSYNTTNYAQTKFVSGSNAVFGKSGSLNPAGTVTVSGTQNIASLLFDTVPSGNYTITGGNLTCVYPSCTITNNEDGTIASTIIGNAGWTKAGAALLTLSGINTYTGNTFVNGGTLNCNSNACLGADTNSVTISNNGTLKFDTGISVTLNQSQIITSGNGTANIILNTGSSLPGNNRAIIVDAFNIAGAALYITGTNTGGHGTAQDTSGQIIGTGIPSGTTALTFDGTAKQVRHTFAPTPNTFTGDVVIIGSVNTQNTATAGNNTADKQNNGFLNNNVTVNAGANWGIVWGGETVQALNGSGNINMNNQNALNNIGLTVGRNNADGAFDGSISGNFGLEKIGTGTQTLSATNTYTGGTIISDGTLICAGDRCLGPPSNSTTIAGNGTLKIDPGTSTSTIQAQIITSGTGTANIIMNTGSSLGGNGTGLSATFNIAGAALSISSINTGGHSTAQDTYGQFIGNAFSSGTTALILDGTQQQYRHTFSLTPSTLTGDVQMWGNVVTQNQTYLDTSAPYQNNGFLNNDVTVNAGGQWTIVWGGETVRSLNGSGNVWLNNQNALNSIGLTVGNNNGSGTHSGVISGGFKLAKIGTGTQTLSGASTYTGGTTISAGKIICTAAGALGTGTVAVSAGATFTKGPCTNATTGAGTIN